MPGVSRKTICVFSKLTTPSIAVRVVWGFSETMASLPPTSAFSNVDLPALGRPAMETKPEWNGGGITWHTYFCVPCSHSCEHSVFAVTCWRSHECERGTQKCVRHERFLAWDCASYVALGYGFRLDFRNADLFHFQIVPGQHFDSNPLALQRLAHARNASQPFGYQSSDGGGFGFVARTESE